MGKLLSRRETYRIVPRDPQYDPSGAAAAAQAFSTADSSQKIVTHSAAVDPHGDRAWGSAHFVPIEYFDGNGQLGTTHLPALSVTDVFPASSEVEMRGLTAQRGDLCVRTDVGRTYILRTDDPTNINNWIEMSSAGQVLSVNGKQGVIVLTAADVGAAPAQHAGNHSPNAADSIANQYVAWTTVGQPSGVEAYGASTTAATTAMNAHLAATDPHGSRAFTTSTMSGHVAASDPHGDRAYAATLVGNINSRLLPAAGTTGQVLAKTGAGDYAVAWTTMTGGGTAGQTDLKIVSVKDFGAVGNGTTDDTAAINNALNAVGPGGVVWLPPGNYAVAAPIVVPPQVTLEGSHTETLVYAGATPIATSIKALASFVGVAVVRCLGMTAGGYAATSVGQKVRRVTIDYSAAPAATKGFQIFGFVREATIEFVTVKGVTGTSLGNGFAVDKDNAAPAGDNNGTAQSLRFLHCVAHNPGGSGFSISACPDTTMIDCNSEGAGYVGFYLAGMANGLLMGCRSEWSAQFGYYILSGSWASGVGSGGFMMFGCASDRNGADGIRVEALGGGQILISGFDARRDGRNNNAGGGNFAAIQAVGATMPVIINGLKVYPGVDDNAANTTTGNSPQFGVRAGTSTYVAVGGACYIHAQQAAFSDNGGNGTFYRGPGIGTATGTTDAPVRTAPSAATPVAEPVNTVATSGAAYTVPDIGTATVHDVTLSASCTFTFPTAAPGKSFTIVLRQDATGGRAVTWPAAVKWPSAAVPTLTTTAGAVDLLTFVSTAAGVWLGSLAAKDVR
jgi:hypothetical protein